MSIRTARGKRIREGTPIATCDRCGRYVKVTERRRDWMGLFVCVAGAGGLPTRGCFEPMHPFLRFQVQPDMSLVLNEPRLPRENFLSTPPSYEATRAEIRALLYKAGSIRCRMHPHKPRRSSSRLSGD